jgi:hypothetical protein
MSETLHLHFGAMAPRLRAQFKAAGVKPVNWKDINLWQRDADAVTRLYIRGFISERETAKARRKLIDRIAAGMVKKGD